MFSFNLLFLQKNKNACDDVAKFLYKIYIL